MLDFNGLRWPHVSVATLRKQADVAGGSAARDAVESTTPGGAGGREVELA